MPSDKYSTALIFYQSSNDFFLTSVKNVSHLKMFSSNVLDVVFDNIWHLIWAGMETMEEIIAVTEAVKNTQTSWLWLGGKYNSTLGKYYWVGSGVAADVAAMYTSYPPTGRVDYNLVLGKPNPKLYALKSSFNSLCEEY